MTSKAFGINSMRIFGKGFNFNQDGPGNRLVYHLSGCNMRCIWCSNPQGFNSDAGEEFSTEEIIAECVSARPMFFSSGGVTFTGGEATLQADGLITILKSLKKENIHTCLETNGTSKRLPEISEYVDYLIMDFKHYDDKRLMEYTGVGCEIIKNNFEWLSKSGKQLHIRIPLINGINTDFPEKFTGFFKKHNTENVIFEFLRYHEFGKEKWQTEYKVKNGFVSDETVNKFKDTFKNYGLKIIET